LLIVLIILEGRYHAGNQVPPPLTDLLRGYRIVPSFQYKKAAL
jgi:hypothetical protein